MDLSMDKCAIRGEIKKCGYTGMVCAKNPPMIKLDGIQFWEYFWD